jgi:hypothetical protein
VRRILDGSHVRRRSARLAPVALAFALLACSGAAVTSPDTAPESSGGAAGTSAPLAAGFSVRLVEQSPPSKSAPADSVDFVLGESVLSQKDVLAVEVAPVRENASERAIFLSLSPAGQRSLAEVSANNVGRHMAIFVGERLVANPVIKTQLSGPSFQITTTSDAELDELAKALGASVRESPLAQ